MAVRDPTSAPGFLAAASKVERALGPSSRPSLDRPLPTLGRGGFYVSNWRIADGGGIEQPDGSFLLKKKAIDATS
jgi:hypothetical protein